MSVISVIKTRGWNVWRVSALEGTGVLLAYFLIPHEAASGGLLGYSWQRWALFGAVLLVQAGLLGGGRLHLRSPHFARLLTRPQVFLMLSAAALILFLGTGRSFLFLDGASRAQFERIRPLLIWFLLIAVQFIAWMLADSKGALWEESGQYLQRLLGRIQQGVASFPLLVERSDAVLVGLLVLAGGFYFYNAVRYEFPLGYAGLYALMSDQLSAAHFRLPFSVPFYGPGGLPYSYPPAAFYIMALVTRAFSLSDLAYLRFAAPFFSLTAVAPLYLVSREVSGSRLAASAAVLFCAFSPRLFIVHTLSAGMVRALAFTFVLLALYFFLRTAKIFRWKDTLLSGLFFGLTALTHFGYAEFFVLMVAAWALTHYEIKDWKACILVGLLGALVAAPWAANQISAHGISVFAGALNSHGNSSFLDLHQLRYLLSDHLQNFGKDALLGGTAILGFFYLAAALEWYLPLSFVLSAVFLSEGDRYLYTIGALAAGILVERVYRSLAERSQLTEVKARFQAGLFIGLVSLAVLWANVPAVMGYRPMINAEIQALAAYFHENTPQDATFLAVVPPEEAEWFPYFVQRTPLVASWGSEWNGTYPQQLGLVLRVSDCAAAQDLSCLDAVFEKSGQSPNYIITHQATENLNAALLKSHRASEAYQNERFIVWEFSQHQIP